MAELNRADVAELPTLSGGSRVKPLDFAMNSNANDNHSCRFDHQAA